MFSFPSTEETQVKTSEGWQEWSSAVGSGQHDFQMQEAGARWSRRAGAAFPWVIKRAAPLDFNLESRWGISEAPGHIIFDAGQRTQHHGHRASTQPSPTPLPLRALASFIRFEKG